MTLRLHLLCSASTPSLRHAAFPKNEPIDDAGRKGLSKLTDRLPSCDRTLRSPALSAAQTAEALGLDSASEPALRDCDFSRWTGRGLEEIHAQEPEALAAWLRDAETAPHGGESFAQVKKRVGVWMDGLPPEDRSVLAITHAAVIRAAIAHALDAPPNSIPHIDVSPLALVTLSGAKGRWRFSALVSQTRLR